MAQSCSCSWDAVSRSAVAEGTHAPSQAAPSSAAQRSRQFPAGVGAIPCPPLAAWNAQTMLAFHCLKWKLISSRQLFSLSFFLLINLLIFSFSDSSVFWKSGQKRTVLVNLMWGMSYQLPAVTTKAAWEECSGKKEGLVYLLGLS